MYFLKKSAAELPSQLTQSFPFKHGNDILLCDHFFPKFSFALNNSPSDEILPTERLVL